LKKILLLGYMGSGKSSVAKVLSEKLSIKKYDIDKIIELYEQQKISKIFRDKGEIYFRNLESRIFREFIDRKDSFVLALGGGTPCYANNHQLLQQKDVISVYLKTSVQTLFDRIKTEIKKRPLISHLSDEGLKDYINKHLFERNFYYYKSKHIVTTDNKNIKQISDEIAEIIFGYFRLS